MWKKRKLRFGNGESWCCGALCLKCDEWFATITKYDVPTQLDKGQKRVGSGESIFQKLMPATDFFYFQFLFIGTGIQSITSDSEFQLFSHIIWQLRMCRHLYDGAVDNDDDDDGVASRRTSHTRGFESVNNQGNCVILFQDITNGNKWNKKTWCGSPEMMRADEQNLPYFWFTWSLRPAAEPYSPSVRRPCVVCTTSHTRGFASVNNHENCTVSYHFKTSQMEI